MKPVPPSAPPHVRKPSAWRLRILRGCAKAHVVVSLLALSFSTTYAASPAPFSGADLLGILALGGVAYGVVLLAGASRVAPWRVNALFAILAVAGVASAHAIHTRLFLTNPVLLWALLGMAGCALFVVFGAIDRSPSVGLALAALGSIAVGLYAAEQLWGRMARPGVVVFGDTSNLRDVAFARRPNIYFLSFDGMAPRVLLREHMGVENTPFHDLFNARFRRFENFFVNAIYTRVALESLLALDERLYDTMVRELRKKTGNGYGQPMFSGHSPSPLFGLLKKNGYETNTAFAGEFFGKRKGPFVDRYFTGGNPLVCNLLDDRVRAFSFWGHCLVVAWRGNAANARARERVIDYLGEASLRDAPQFAMAHVYAPGHVGRSFFRYGDKAQLAAFRAHYRRGSAEAAGLLARLLAHLDENDPSAILLVYGDHGPLLSTNTPFADAPDFVVQDHYGVLGGVHPPTACEQWFDEALARRGYLTLLDAAHVVIRCLTDGESALAVMPADHKIGDWQGVVPDGHAKSYSAFLYE